MVRRRWSPARMLDPTALGSVRAGLWWNIGLLVAALRVGTVIQMLPSLPLAVRSSERPALTVLAWTLALALTAVLCVGVARNKRPPYDQMALFETVAMLALFGLGFLTVAPEDRVGNWVAFQPAYALSLMIGLSVLTSRRVWLLVLVLIPTADVLFCMSAESVDLPTLIGNVLTLVVLPTITRLAFRYTTRIADLADESAARVAEFARREEERRAQAAMHNGAAVMALLARDDLDRLDAGARQALRVQARTETERMRRYLTGDQLVRADRRALAAVAEGAAAGFPDLRIDLITDLGAHVLVSPEQAEAVSAALTSILLNVRLHAGAQRVVLHLDEEDGSWTLTLHDDGVGFDVATVREGVGLREVVRAELARQQIAVAIDSMLGTGTTVVLRGTHQELR